MEAGARQRLAAEHLSLVRAIAAQVKKQVSPRLDMDDLIGYGTQGLLEAADRFDPRQGCSFVTYAYHRVRGAIYDGLRHMGHLPRSEYARLQAAERAHEVLENLAERDRGAAAAVGPAPTVEDDVRSLYAALAAVATSYVTSLEALAEEGHDLADDRLTPHEEAAARMAGRRVREAIATLPEKERHFIEKHYFEDLSLKEAGEQLGLSKSWASRMHARALDLLRARLAEE